ncbi:MAG: Bacterial alpha-L-rhamnosidase [Lentisphaerae bacterium ADurb.Bin242]|nr:MAG: Bacterial alpha-L-rhamnosidase [Lentisphaerae bacterium ADurb.Bin242]
MKIHALQTEGLTEPLGIAEENPRFSWKIESDENCFLQEAYEIELDDDIHSVWRSGRIESGESVNVEGCPRLKALTSYSWRVRIRASDKWSPWSSRAHFETGMLHRRWTACWIAGIHNGEVKQPVNYLRKEFSLSGTVRKARLYSTALGVYEATLNGKAVSPDCFAPGWTDYFFHVQHQTYDITDLLRSGRNVIGVKLGEGWYCGSISRRRNSGKPSYGDKPVFLAEMHLEYENGKKEIVATDDSWECSIGGPIRMSDIYDGELYDAHFELGAWDAPGYPATGWSRCLLKNRRIRIEGITAPPVRRTEVLKVREWHDVDVKFWTPEPYVPPPARLTVIDFGQNLVGREHLKIRIPEGAAIVIKHGEMLSPDGTVYLKNLRSALATTTLTGNGREMEYEPLFTFYGFRYLQIADLPEDFDPGSMEAYVIHTDLKRTGNFHCSDEWINQLYANQLWSNRCNYLDIPTDCPQRDERLGWLGDAQIFIKTAGYNFDIDGFFTKYLADVNYGRTGYGEYPPYAPFFAVNHLDAYFFGTDYYKGHSGSADAAILCPYQLFLKYRDRRIVERYFDNILQWIRYQEANSEGLIRKSVVWRDWLNHNDPTSEELISTAFFAYGTSLAAILAREIGRHSDAEELDILAQEIRNAFRNRFMTENGHLTEKSQTAALLALHFDLLPEEFRPNVFADLVSSLEARDTHLSTGFLGTPYLAHVLTRFGRGDLAGRLIEQTTFPSWLYPVLQGATTIWERWNSYSRETGILPEPMNSFNHYAYGSIADFFYDTIGGIRPDPAHPGFKRILLSPTPCGSLRSAECSYDSPMGMISTRWKSDDGKIRLEVSIPANTTAELRFPGITPEDVRSEDGSGLPGSPAPDGTALELGSGRYRFVFDDRR